MERIVRMKEKRFVITGSLVQDLTYQEVLYMMIKLCIPLNKKEVKYEELDVIELTEERISRDE